MVLGLKDTVVEDAAFQTELRGRKRKHEVLVVKARPAARRLLRCPVCLARRPFRDAGRGRRRWRTLDFGVFEAYVEADAPRVACPETAREASSVRGSPGFRSRSRGRFRSGIPWCRCGLG
jgi:transposase